MIRGRDFSKVDFQVILLLSGIGMAYEISLLRVFAYSQWHHFASIVVSLALLGFGTAGTILTFMGKRRSGMSDGFFLTGMLIAAFGMLLSVLLPMLIQVRPMFAVWDWTELGKLLLLDFACFVPFLGIALCIGQVFMRWPEATRRFYAANLIGSGLGTLMASILLSFIFLEAILILMPLAMLATAAFHAHRRKMNRIAVLTPGILCILLAVWVIVPPALPLSDFKRLSYLLDLPDASIVEERPSMQAGITVIQSESIRIAPGLSLQWPEPIPSSDALVLGSDLALPMPGSSGQAESPAYLKASLGMLPFHLRQQGTGIYFGASEWFPTWYSPLSSSSWILESDSLVKVYSSRGLPDKLEARQDNKRLLKRPRALTPTVVYFNSAYVKGSATGEDYLLTVESITRAVKMLDQNGVLAIPMPVEYPPRHATKLMSMIRMSLDDLDLKQASAHVAIIRSLRDALFIVSKSPLSQQDLSAIREYAQKWEFDLIHLPGLHPDEANRFHQFAEPVLYQTAQFFLNDSGSLPDASNWYSLQPATDKQPYFWKSTKLTQVPEFLRQYGQQGLTWLDWDLLLSFVKLVFAGLLATILILVPLAFLPRPAGKLSFISVCLYFSALGLGFLTLEMVAFQQVQLFIPNPVLAATVIFTVFLIGAGIGSLSTPKSGSAKPHLSIFLTIGICTIPAYGLLNLSKNPLLHMPSWMSLFLIVCCLCPLSWALGRAFPWGLRQLDIAPNLIPWAWGINGFASVIAAPTAVLLAVNMGQGAVWLAGLACYLLAGLIARTWAR